jgi:hypothetical protein
VLVDPRDEDLGAVGGPPVPAGPAHLLSGDELGEAERDVLAVGFRDHSVPARLEVQDVERSAVHVGDLGAGGVGARIDSGRLGRHEPRRDTIVAEAGRVDVAGQREHGERLRLVGRVRDDAGAGLPDSFPAGAFLRRQVLVGAEEARVGDQAFGAGDGVGLP